MVGANEAMSVCTQKAKLSPVSTLEPFGAMKEAKGIMIGLHRLAVQLDCTSFMVVLRTSMVGKMAKRTMIQMD